MRLVSAFFFLCNIQPFHAFVTKQPIIAARTRQGLFMSSEDTIPEEPVPVDIETELVELLKLGAATGRGEFATKAQHDQAQQHIEALEAASTEPSSSLEGTWELVYSSTQLFRSSPFFMAGRAVCSTAEEAQRYDWFCDMHRAALAISNIGAVRQIISEDRLVSEFEVKSGSVPFVNVYSGGLPVAITGAIVSSAEIVSKIDQDLELLMDTVEIKGSNLPGLRQILDSGLKLQSRQLGGFLEDNVSGYTNPKPLFETTFLTDSVRISRDQDGKVFVYTKVSDSTEPTDYSNVTPDLGVIKLLEGLNDSFIKFYL